MRVLCVAVAVVAGIRYYWCDPNRFPEAWAKWFLGLSVAVCLGHVVTWAVVKSVRRLLSIQVDHPDELLTLVIGTVEGTGYALIIGLFGWSAGIDGAVTLCLTILGLKVAGNWREYTKTPEQSKLEKIIAEAEGEEEKKAKKEQIDEKQKTTRKFWVAVFGHVLSFFLGLAGGGICHGHGPPFWPWK